MVLGDPQDENCCLRKLARRRALLTSFHSSKSLLHLVMDGLLATSLNLLLISSAFSKLFTTQTIGGFFVVVKTT